MRLDLTRKRTQFRNSYASGGEALFLREFVLESKSCKYLAVRALLQYRAAQGWDSMAAQII